MFKRIIVTMLLGAASIVNAADITIATGDAKSGSTYAKMMEEIKPFCSRLDLGEINTSGSVENVALLTANKTNAAIVQSDMLTFQKNNDPQSVENVHTVAALHPEELHFLTLNKPFDQNTGIFARFTKKEFVRHVKLSDIRGKTLGAVGGSVVSANVVSQYAGLNLEIIEYKSNDDLIQALSAGNIAAALVVAGSPHKAVASLPDAVQILEIDNQILDMLTASDSSIYRKAVLSYNNLKQTGIQTVSVDALLVSRQYRSPRMIENLKELRRCITDNVYELQDSLGTHPKWQAVDPEYKGKWQWYALPANKPNPYEE